MPAKDYTQGQVRKIASFDESLWAGVERCDMRTFQDVPDRVMERAYHNVNDWLVRDQKLHPIGMDVFIWRIKQALRYELESKYQLIAVHRPC